MWKDHSIKQPAHYLFQAMLWLAIACAFVLFIPSKISSALQLSYVIDNYIHVVGILFIISASYLLIDIVTTGLKQLKANNLETTQKQQIEQRIKTLVTGERAVLREFFLQRKTSLWLPKDESDVKSLVSSGILMPIDFYSQSRQGNQGASETELMISHNARPYLSKQRLNLPQGKPSYEDIHYLKSARPAYLATVTHLKRTA
jgi:hypothetical protein